ncbi:MAG TPA: hypothetical protein V6D08_12905 [Candidatus Obscuribacterales bacterium]
MEPEFEDRRSQAVDVTKDVSGVNGADASEAFARELMNDRRGAGMERAAMSRGKGSHADPAKDAWTSAFGSFSTTFADLADPFQVGREPAPSRQERRGSGRPGWAVDYEERWRRTQPAEPARDRRYDPGAEPPLPPARRPDEAGRQRIEPPRDGADNQPRVTVRDGGEIGFPPRRPGYQMGGSEFFRTVLQASGNPKDRGVMGPERERAILEQIEAGNIPDFMRRFKTITVTDSAGNRAELQVMPDYLAIGTDSDFVRVPVTPLLAKALADRYGLALPTRKVVDDIYQQADVRLVGRGLVQTKQDQNYMQGNGFYLQHNDLIERQLGGRGQGALVAGHKKDIIVSRYAETHPGGLDFYGLFKANGEPTQKNPAHENTYVDYSHGARFISQDVIVNGRPMRYDEVLSNPQLAGLLSYEGPVHAERIYKRPIDRAYADIVAAGSSRYA